MEVHGEPETTSADEQDDDANIDMLRALARWRDQKLGAIPLFVSKSGDEQRSVSGQSGSSCAGRSDSMV